jgi:hypothetical protein
VAVSYQSCLCGPGAASDTGADLPQSVSPTARAHAQACDNIAAVLLSCNDENDAVLAKEDAACAQQAGTLASLLEVRDRDPTVLLTSDIDNHIMHLQHDRGSGMPSAARSWSAR